MPLNKENENIITAGDLTAWVQELYEINIVLDRESLRLVPRCNPDEWIIIRRRGKSHFYVQISNRNETAKYRFGGKGALNDFLTERYSEQLRFA